MKWGSEPHRYLEEKNFRQRTANTKTPSCLGNSKEASAARVMGIVIGSEEITRGP